MAGRISDRDIAAIRERVSIEDIVGDYVQLRRAGADSMKGLCPFHDEKSPSFHVRPNHGHFHCFGCGFARSGWDTLTKHLLRKGFEFKELEAAGLSREGRRGPMDRFHRRLLWPIRSSAGEVIGFGARRLFDDDPMEAKYVNTPETPLYKKSHVLFGIDLAKRDIAKGHQAVVVEGYTDVMAMHLAGVA